MAADDGFKPGAIWRECRAVPLRRCFAAAAHEARHTRRSTKTKEDTLSCFTLPRHEDGIEGCFCRFYLPALQWGA